MENPKRLIHRRPGVKTLWKRDIHDASKKPTEENWELSKGLRDTVTSRSENNSVHLTKPSQRKGGGGKKTVTAGSPMIH